MSFWQLLKSFFTMTFCQKRKFEALTLDQETQMDNEILRKIDFINEEKWFTQSKKRKALILCLLAEVEKHYLQEKVERELKILHRSTT